MKKVFKQLSPVEHSWLGLEDEFLHIDNHLIHRDEWDIENPGPLELRLMRDSNYLSFAADILLNVQLLPFQAAILEELYSRPFPMLIMARGASKSFLLAVYCLLKMSLHSNQKIVLCGAAFRQAKVIFEYMEAIWRNADILRSVADKNSGPKRDIDRCVFHLNGNTATAIPLGQGDKIRGLRANIIVADEFGAIAPDVFETVVQGFVSVSSNPVINAKLAARRTAARQLGIWSDKQEEYYGQRTTNQSIISGTATYSFEHFAEYWRRYKTIVESRGNPEYLERNGIDSSILDVLSWKDFSVIRVPYELIPEGFMDEKQVAKAKATIHTAIYQMEYGATFPTDSNGFFRRSLIEGCVGTDIKPVKLSSGNIWFDASIRGKTGCQYIMGIDPASENDNFSIVILELHADHRRVVYCWSTNKQDFRARLRIGLTTENDYFSFCTRKIRQLMSVFPLATDHPCIGCDSQGGGFVIDEALHDKSRLKEGEIPIWQIIDPSKEKETDYMAGLHILELINFAKPDWTAEANHGMKRDLEDKVLLFPRFDPVTLAASTEMDKELVRRGDSSVQFDSQSSRLYDSFEDCVLEIEELKNELTTIEMSRTGTGVSSRDRWDTPETKLKNGRKGRLRKDRYSALLIANMLARRINKIIPPPNYDAVGGFVGQIRKADGKLYIGPDWFEKGVNDGGFGLVIKK